VTGNAVVAQGGGPTAVINASLYGVADQLARDLPASARLLGACGGIAGVLAEHWIDLRRPDAGLWQAIRLSPGAALGSCRKMLSAGEAGQAVETLRRLDVRYFFYIGGNDSMDTALKISQAASAMGYELISAGIPKTVDNDLPVTDHCPGFGSAARYFSQSAVDLGMDIGSLPTPVCVLETIGRNTGWLVAATMAARAEPGDAPHLIYVPEVPLTADRFLADVDDAYQRLGWVVAAVSEGVRDEVGRGWGEQGGGAADGFGHAMPGDVAAALAGLVTARLGLRARGEKPGLCGRSSGVLSSGVDRDEAEAVARFAAAHAAAGHSGFMAAIVREPAGPYAVRYEAAALSSVANVERKLPLEYLTPAQNDIAEPYRAYVEPLMGGPLCRYAHLKPKAAKRSIA
jgi:ATP-dependent phosphofructokinase / diphosphate-dependent phosphofructokinase